MSMSDYINKTDAAYDDPFDISEITSAYECVKGDPFDISGLSAAIESKAGEFIKKVSPKVFENFNMPADKARKMYNSLVTFMCKKGWLIYTETEDTTKRVVAHNWKESTDHFIDQEHFDSNDITELGRKYLRQLYKTITKKASDNGWTIDELIVKAKEDAKAKAVAIEIFKSAATAIGINVAMPVVTFLELIRNIILTMVVGSTGARSIQHVRDKYEGNAKVNDTAAYESMVSESIANTLNKESNKESEKEDNKKENFIDLRSLYKVEINPGAIDNYKDKFHQLYHINRNARKLCGYMYFMNSSGKKGDLVAFVSVKSKSGKNWIDTLEVCPDYRGNKLSHQLLDVASNQFNATDVAINADNKFAIRVFNKYGFIPYLEREGKIYMSTDSDTIKSSNYTHAAKESSEIPATEAALKKPSKSEYTKSVIEHLQKQLNTPEQRVNYEKLLTQNMSVFKSTLTELKKLESRHERSLIMEQNYFKDRQTAESMLKRLAAQVGVDIRKIVETKSEVLDIDGYLDAYEFLKAIKQSL